MWCYSFHFLKHHFFKIVFLLWHSIVKISLKSGIGQFVPLFILPIILTIFLYSIVRQVNKLIIKLLQIKSLRRSPYITWLIPVPLNQTIHWSNKQIVSNIKFPTIIQKRSQIFLYNVCFWLTIFMKLFIFYFIRFQANYGLYLWWWFFLLVRWLVWLFCNYLSKVPQLCFCFTS